ncbi:uncharacterized protein LOC114805383 [Zeugodacus cucurbitae]|uniref:uncharacterized protein LOC114805383 n=1 Tax=Zeugodacus cucurbitae TaxID=28588 RepID=UPI0010A74B1B|nr:uncharacterized protein LOC114805383 [Zeugodacus cucurbitae]
MNFYKLVVVCFLTAVAEAKFEDFVIKDRNDLTRFGYDDDIGDADYEFDEASFSNLELLQQLAEVEPNIMDLLNGVSLQDLPPGLLLKLQQYSEMMDTPTCMDDDNMWEFGELPNSYDANAFNDVLQLE